MILLLYLFVLKIYLNIKKSLFYQFELDDDYYYIKEEEDLEGYEPIKEKISYVIKQIINESF